ncbi:MAG: type II toxin-antitoxin system HicA family toxin [Acidaminobacteraceae bacterium]
MEARMSNSSNNSRELLKQLKDDGWEVVRIKGSHHQLRHPTKKGLVTLPHPKKDLPRKTVESILKQAGLRS